MVHSFSDEKSHPTWVRGLKPVLAHRQRQPMYVAPYMGAWIETGRLVYGLQMAMVAPYMGAWIETSIK